jgi:methionyl-tRNA synthetase
MSYSSYFITTAIPYVNSKPHIGHAQEFILADFLARYYKQRGQSVILQSGTDDNATKNVIAAKEAGIPTKEFVDLNSDKFLNLLKSLNVEPDIFVRTSRDPHKKSVQSFLKSLNPKDVYDSNYSGLYCSGCEDFYNEQDLVNGLCPDHLKKPENIEEKNVFFRLSEYQEELYRLINTNIIKITPTSKKKEILSFIKQGLTDISLSRSSLRTQDWGIPYPDIPGQTVYVWIDALVNYISGHKDVWREDVFKIHVIGKNVWKFHAIYWPALLLSAGLPLPNEIVIHGFLTNEGVKISKSLGNGIDPLEVIGKYGVEALRFYLLGVLSFEQDADFVEKKLADAYNSELANKLGNVASRILNLGKSVDYGDHELENILTIDYKSLRREAFERIGVLNSEINDVKPWELQKNSQVEELSKLIRKWTQELQSIAHLLAPLIPEGSEKLLRTIKNRPEIIPQLYPRHL